MPGLQQMSEDQLFFLSFASVWCEAQTLTALAQQLNTDVHAPALARVTGVLQNYDQFRKAFNCPEDAYMSKPFDSETRQCKLW